MRSVSTWADPYAEAFEVQYGLATATHGRQNKGSWKTFIGSNSRRERAALNAGFRCRTSQHKIRARLMTRSQQLRHSRFPRSSQLRGLCRPRALSLDHR